MHRLVLDDLSQEEIIAAYPRFSEIYQKNAPLALSSKENLHLNFQKTDSFVKWNSQWLFNGIAGGLVLFATWSPVVMFIGGITGGIAGYTCYYINCTLAKRKQRSAETLLKQKFDNLMRWASFQMALHSEKYYLLIKVILEFEALSNKKDKSPAEVGCLSLLNKFLWREDVGYYLWDYITKFFNNSEHASPADISLCRDVIRTCILCNMKCGRNDTPPIVSLMKLIEKDPNALALLEHGRDFRRILQKGKQGEQDLLRTGSSTENLNLYPLVQRLESINATPTNAFTPLVGETTETAADKIITKSFSISSLEKRDTRLSNVTRSLNSKCSIFEGISEEAILRKSGASESELEVSLEDTRLFRSYQDLVDFDSKLKLLTPIALYEFEFLDQFEPHETASSKWELAAQGNGIFVYKQLSTTSPVVLVKAYVELPKIPAEVARYHIEDVNVRKSWDTTFSDFRLVEKDINGCEIIYCLLKSPFPLAYRDFLQWRRVVVDESNTIRILHRSAAHASYGETSNIVRAETIISGYIIRQSSNDSSSSKMFLVAQTDVKGLIPKWITNTFSSRAPVAWAEKLRKVCRDYIQRNNITPGEVMVP